MVGVQRSAALIDFHQVIYDYAFPAVFIAEPNCVKHLIITLLIFNVFEKPDQNVLVFIAKNLDNFPKVIQVHSISSDAVDLYRFLVEKLNPALA